MWSPDTPPVKALGGPWGMEGLQDLAGNMWNAFSYTRVKMALVGAVDWDKVKQLKEARVAKKAPGDDAGFSDSDWTSE